jgi:hypothetical protein
LSKKQIKFACDYPGVLPYVALPCSSLPRWPRFKPRRELPDPTPTLRAKLFCRSTKFSPPRDAKIVIPSVTPRCRATTATSIYKIVKRGKDGHGVYGMRCDTCHQTTNLSGEHMPPGNPKWSLPSPEHKMIIVGRSPAELCRQLKDPKQTGGRSLQQLLEHVSSDDLVGWAWDPGTGRTPPPLSRAETIAQMKIWIDGGAACPQ